MKELRPVSSRTEFTPTWPVCILRTTPLIFFCSTEQPSALWDSPSFHGFASIFWESQQLWDTRSLFSNIIVFFLLRNIIKPSFLAIFFMTEAEDIELISIFLGSSHISFESFQGFAVPVAPGSFLQ